MKKVFLLFVIGVMFMGLAYANVENVEVKPGEEYACGVDKFTDAFRCVNYRYGNDLLKPGFIMVSGVHIEEVVELKFGGRYDKHGLIVYCQNLEEAVYDMKINTTHTFNDKLVVNCAIDYPDPKAENRTLLPGQSWYSIHCEKPPAPIEGIIQLEENTTFEEVYMFESVYGLCQIEIDPTRNFLAHLDFARDYQTASRQHIQCQDELNECERDNSRYSWMLALIIGGAALIVFFWYRDLKGGFRMNTGGGMGGGLSLSRIKDSISKKKEDLNNANINKENIEVKSSSEKEYIKRQKRNELRDRFLK